MLPLPKILEGFTVKVEEKTTVRSGKTFFFFYSISRITAELGYFSGMKDCFFVRFLESQETLRYSVITTLIQCH